MRLLVDSNVLLWWLQGSSQLSADAAAVMADAENELVFSAVSIWELAIKQSVGKLRVDVDLRAHALANGFVELAVTGVHGAAVRDLPFHHRDPFDRLLVAQAQLEGLTILTGDEMLTRYPAPVMLATG
jgi:PIN domain nuclease of toxin-antitoxin system